LFFFIYFSLVALLSNAGHGLFIIEVSRSHSLKPLRSVGRVISPSQRTLYLTTHNTHKRQTSLLAAGCEPSIPARQRMQTHALGRATPWDRQ